VRGLCQAAFGLAQVIKLAFVPQMNVERAERRLTQAGGPFEAVPVMFGLTEGKICPRFKRINQVPAAGGGSAGQLL